MDTAEPEPYDPLYLEGIEKFNECDHFESHELWEELWTEYRGPSRDRERKSARAEPLQTLPKAK